MLRDTQMLIGRCIRREDKAWEEFIERFSGLLFYSARECLKKNGILFSQYDLEDIVQTVFLELLEKGRLEEVRERKKIIAWLSIVTQTRALNYMRGKKERLLRQEEFYRIDNIKVERQEPMDEGLALELEKAVEDLDAREKIILKMNIIHGKSHKEIAKFMKMPMNTVSTIIARKKESLRKKLRNFERK